MHALRRQEKLNRIMRRRCQVEHALSILYAFASSIYANEAVATNKFNSQPIWMIDHELD